MKRLVTIGAALAMTLAGAFPLHAGDRGEDWGALLKRCDSRMRQGPEKKGLGGALDRMSERDRARLRARLKRIELLTRAWVRAERQARTASAARAILAVFGTAPAPVDLRPTLDFIMELNGLGTKRVPGVLGKRGKKMT